MLRLTAALALAVAASSTGAEQRTIEDYAPTWSPRGDRLTFVRRVQDGARHTYSTWLVTERGTLLRRFAGAKQSVWSPDGRLLALVRPARPTARIFVTGRNGTAARLLGVGTGPSWSPSGAEVAFTYVRGRSAEQRPRAYVVRHDGARLRQLAPSAASSAGARWSPDGRLLAFVGYVRATGWGLYVVRPDGTGLRRVLAARRSRLPVAPRWSPDGTRLLTWSLQSQRLVVVPVVGGATSERGLGSAASWSPDGSRIAYVQRCRIVVVAVRAPGPRDAPVCSVHGFLGAPRWSPGGDRIAFHECFHDICWVFLRDARTNERTKLGRGTQPAWSPDGRRIAFVRSGRVFLMAADGSGARPLLRPRASR